MQMRDFSGENLDSAKRKKLHEGNSEKKHSG